MGRGTRYPQIEKILEEYRAVARVLEFGAGGAVYSSIFDNHIATDLPGCGYANKGDLDVHCDARHLPFRPGSFDLVFGVASLLVIPDPELVLQDAWLALKPGGTLIIFDYTPGIKVRNTRQHLAQGSRITFNYWTATELGRALERSGYSGVRRHPGSRSRLGTLREQLAFGLVPALAEKHYKWLIFSGRKPAHV